MLLTEECGSCYGTGLHLISGSRPYKQEICSACRGTGTVPNELGEAVLALVASHAGEPELTAQASDWQWEQERSRR